MDSLLSLIPKEQLVYALIGVLLPTVVAALLYVKAEKDKIVGFVVEEIDDVLADLNQAKVNLVNAIDFVEDAIEGLVEGLSPDSPGGRTLTDEEKAESLEMAQKALSELKKAKDKVLESVRLSD